MTAGQCVHLLCDLSPKSEAQTRPHWVKELHETTKISGIKSGIFLKQTNFWRFYTTVKSHFKALGLYNFKRGFGWAYKRGGLYPGGLISGIIYSLSNRWARTTR